MVTRLGVRSLSRPVQQRIEAERCSHGASHWARVLAVFERAANLILHDGSVVALVLADIGDGPLNIVVAGETGSFEALMPGMPVHLDDARFQVGNLELVLSEAAAFEPLPDWKDLRFRCAEIEGRLSLAEIFALSEIPAESLAGMATGWSSTAATQLESDMLCGGTCRTETSMALSSTMGEAARHLHAGWDGNSVRLRAGAAQLAGLGGGLTPSGDDFLCGAMLWAWLAHSDPRGFCDVVLEVSATRTTTLSAALLRSAAAGECSAVWQRFLESLADGRERSIRDTVRAVLSHGHTSGADALAGFLWMGLRPERRLRNSREP